MKYTGHIIGIRPNSSISLHNIVNSDSAVVWRASVIAIIEENAIHISYNYEGDAYTISLGELKEEYYTGKLISSNEECGRCIFYVYKRQNEFLLRGDYIDDWSGQWESIIELRPIEK